MGKDFRVGLMTGVVLAGAALIWVATRPSLSLRARVPRPASAGANQGFPTAEAGQVVNRPLPWESLEPADANHRGESALTSPPALPATEGPQEVNEPRPVSRAPSPEAQATSPAPTRSAWPDQTIYEQDQPIQTTRFHIVRKGDTLSSIAAQYLGSSAQWRKILKANAKTIKDPNKISPGTKLIIPD